MLFLVLALLGCDGGASTAPAPQRVDVVAAKPADPKVLESFCDQHPAEADAKPFAWPALAGEAPAAASGWRWVNVWATWCGPCVEEIPMLTAWKDKLAKDGAAVDLVFLSFDESQTDIDRFLPKHPGFTPGPRIAGKDAIAPWFAGLGLDANTAIPLHVFVDPAGKVRCTRGGAIADHDYAAVKQLLTGG